MKCAKCILRCAALQQTHTVTSHRVGMELLGVCVQRTVTLKHCVCDDCRDKNENKRSEIGTNNAADAIFAEILTQFVCHQERATANAIANLRSSGLTYG
jgi:hypothetical protein